jgi:hypothetical protein
MLLALAVIAALPAQAFAWGSGGHAIVAEIASRHLSARAKAEVSALLAGQGQASLAGISLWADMVKALGITHEPSHVVRLPLDHSAYDPAKVCKTGRCATAAVETYSAILRDRSKPGADRLAALKYLVHLVGDLHQPLHTSADTGGRAVAVSGEKTTLHAVWDAAIIDSRQTDWRALVALVETAPTGPVEPSTPVGWALEGRDIARDMIFADARLAAARHGALLPAGYLDDNWPIVRTRLKQAGLRLALLLDESLSAD